MLSNYSYLNGRYGKFYNLLQFRLQSHRTYYNVRSTVTIKCPVARFQRLRHNCILQRLIHSRVHINNKSVDQRWKEFSEQALKVIREQNARSGRQPRGPQNDNFVAKILLFITTILIFKLVQLNLVQEISWHTFVQEILLKGEVDKLSYHRGWKGIMVTVKPGAVIGGKKVDDKKMYLLPVEDLETFEEDLREIEENLGIPPKDRLFIANQPDSDITFFDIVVGVLFIGFLVGMFQKGLPIMSNFRQIRKAKFTVIDPLSGHTKGVKFSDVGGLKEAKMEIMEFIDYLTKPENYKKLGAKVPRGALLLGPPGCGKTLLAKAVASEANVPFLSVNGSEFIELIGGLGAARVRDLFSEAKNISPCIIYIDEIDAIGKNRSSGDWTGARSEAEHTLNQLLVEMDGMASREGVVMLASTNRADVLDKALLRPGRFDRHIMIDLPNIEERTEIFTQYLKAIKLEHKPEHYARRMASLTPGFSGADIANICNEAALHAALMNNKVVKANDLEYAVDRVVGGTEKRSSVISPEEKSIVAYHEAGRALIGWLSEHGEILLKVSVVPRTHQTVGWSKFSVTDQYLFTEQELFVKMCMALGGRAAETIIFNHISTKSEKDLQKVTRMAYAQVKQFGMNKSVGPISFGDVQHYKKPYSKYLSTLMDEEVRKMVAKAFFTAESVLTENKDKLIKLAETLLKKETMNYDEVVEVIGPPRNPKRKMTEPLLFDLSIDMAAGPEPPRTEQK